MPTARYVHLPERLAGLLDQVLDVRQLDHARSRSGARRPPRARPPPASRGRGRGGGRRGRAPARSAPASQPGCTLMPPWARRTRGRPAWRRRRPGGARAARSPAACAWATPVVAREQPEHRRAGARHHRAHRAGRADVGERVADRGAERPRGRLEVVVQQPLGEQRAVARGARDLAAQAVELVGVAAEAEAVELGVDRRASRASWRRGRSAAPSGAGSPSRRTPSPIPVIRQRSGASWLGTSAPSATATSCSAAPRSCRTPRRRAGARRRRRPSRRPCRRRPGRAW